MVSCKRSKGRKSQSPTLAPLQPPHALCRAELAEPLSADSAQTEPCAPIRDKFAFGKLCFLFSPTHLFLKCLAHFVISSIIKILLFFNKFIDRTPSPLFPFPLASPIFISFWERVRNSAVRALSPLIISQVAINSALFIHLFSR